MGQFTNRYFLRKKLARYGPYLFAFLFVFTIWFYVNASQKEHYTLEKASIELYSNQAGDSLRSLYLAHILQATESITCISYSITDQMVIDALRHKSMESCDVSVQTDHSCYPFIEKKLGDKVHFEKKRVRGLMHQKLLACDRRFCLLGSCNLTKDSLDNHANLVIGIDSEVVASKIEERKEKKVCEPISFQLDNQLFTLSFLPEDKKALSNLVHLLQGAKKSLRVAMFTFTHPLLIDAVIACKKRGVKVEVVLDNESSQKTSRIALERFKNADIDVRQSNRLGLLHEKIAIIDDTIFVGGSANWTKAAFTINDEHIFTISPLTSVQAEKLHQFWKTTYTESS